MSEYCSNFNKYVGMKYTASITNAMVASSSFSSALGSSLEIQEFVGPTHYAKGVSRSSLGRRNLNAHTRHPVLKEF